SSGPSSVTSLPRTCTSTNGCWASMVRSKRSCGPSRRTMAMPSTRMTSRRTGTSGTALSSVAKGFFRQGATENVGVDVEHGLACGRARVEDEPELAVAVLLRERSRRRDHLGEQGGVARPELDDIAVFGRLGHDEQVNGCLGGDVADRDDRVA